jgi:hypothetical protein
MSTVSITITQSLSQSKMVEGFLKARKSKPLFVGYGGGRRVWNTRVLTTLPIFSLLSAHNSKLIQRYKGSHTVILFTVTYYLKLHNAITTYYISHFLAYKSHL